jgi:hypothetical protein
LDVADFQTTAKAVQASAPFAHQSPTPSKPAVICNTVKELFIDGCQIFSPTWPDFHLLHYHGTGGLTLLEDKFAEKAARGELGSAVTVVLPLAEYLVHNSKTTNAKFLFDMWRYIKTLPDEMIDCLYRNPKTGLTRRQKLQLLMKNLDNPNVWHLFAFKNGKPDRRASIPLLKEAAHKFGQHTDEVLLLTGVKRLLRTGFSMGAGVLAIDTYFRKQTDPRLISLVNIMVGAPIFYEDCMGEIVNPQAPMWNILGKYDPLPDILDFNAHQVRSLAVKYGYNITVRTPPLPHQLPCKLAWHILRRTIRENAPIPRYTHVAVA